MKQHPFRLRLPHRLVSSVQFRFAVTFTILVAILLALMNTYPTRASRDIVFTEKQSALTNRAAVVSSSLSLLDNLTPDNTRQVLALLDLRDLTRIIVTDSEGLAVYDSASENNIRGKYVLYPELVRALDGQAVFYSHYTTGAFLSRAAMPVMNSGRTVGAVYVCESDGERAALIGSIQRRLATITIGIGAAALVVLWFSIKMLTRRITQLADGVRTVQRGEQSILSVADTGIGIPEADRPNIFNRFYRVDKARSREHGGSGLGLSIVHDAAALYGGVVTVDGVEPHGTRFTVTFPRAAASGAPETQKEVPET